MRLPKIPVHPECGSSAAVTRLAYAATTDHVVDVYACATCRKTFEVRSDDPDDDRRVRAKGDAAAIRPSGTRRPR